MTTDAPIAGDVHVHIDGTWHLLSRLVRGQHAGNFGWVTACGATHQATGLTTTNQVPGLSHRCTECRHPQVSGPLGAHWAAGPANTEPSLTKGKP